MKPTKTEKLLRTTRNQGIPPHGVILQTTEAQTRYANSGLFGILQIDGTSTTLQALTKIVQNSLYNEKEAQY